MTLKQHAISLIWWVPVGLTTMKLVENIESVMAFVIGGFIALTLCAIDGYIFDGRRR